jgi:hypothetical protein
MSTPNTKDYDTISATFYAYMETAPEAQKEAFKHAVLQLMRCFGEAPSCSILAGFIDRKLGTIEVNGLCMTPEEMPAAVQAMATAIEAGQQDAPEGTVLQ